MHIKKIITILFITISSIGFSQDALLFENTWYLNALIINGVEYPSPVNSEIPYISAEFTELADPNYFTTNICGYDCNGSMIFNGTTEFTLQAYNFVENACADLSNQNFENLHHQYWLSSLFTNSSYSIVNDGSSLTLTIVNFYGDEAIYSADLLSTYDFELDILSISPNPTEDIIYIQKSKNISISKIKIFDINGKLVFSTNSFDDHKTMIDLQVLNKGIYFVSIENSHNQFFTRKVIKK